ncbi:hypothetical protein Taro_049060 [Colocasia esculenta]|uniref:RING-type domain-containing protein n=1 Tax=Colocasia esculenta TaxID=4460 RepID=A0A843X9U6_COLES|nr:hypothetical protein [Colocasia esculenta]
MAYPQQHHHLTQQQQQQQPRPFRNFVPIDGQVAPATLAFVSSGSIPEQPLPQNPPSFMQVMGLAPAGAADVGGGSSGWGEAVLSLQPPLGKRRMKEQELLNSSPVSTGLGLSLDDRRLAAASSSSGDSSSLLLMLDDEIDRELRRQEAEMERFLKIQGEQLRQAILEKVQSKQLETLASVEEKISRRLREKEAEVEDINRRNWELEEQMKQLTAEVGTWQNRAKYNENMIGTLRYHLQQVAQSRDSKEGCGDSEVDDTASCCNVKPIDFELVCKDSKDLKELMTCKVCRVSEVCMLLLPCRHLCLCKNCESKLSFCPMCQSSKVIGMEIYM